MNRPTAIAYLEDDAIQGRTVSRWLTSSTMQCRLYTTAESLIEALEHPDPVDALVLDMELDNGHTGFEVLEYVRRTQQPRIPVLMVSCKCDSQRAVAALTAGADDFLKKPLAKSTLNVHLQRLLGPTGTYRTDTDRPCIHFEGTCARLSPKDEPVGLTESEYSLASMLFSHVGKILSQECLLSALSFTSSESMVKGVAAIDRDMRRLKKKLKLQGGQGAWQLESIYHHGYRLTNARDDEYAMRQNR